MAPHWKCGSGQPVAGSNPALSAIRPPDDPAGAGRPRSAREPIAKLSPRASLLDFAGRARRGTSGALNLQSAPAGLNSLPRTASLQAAVMGDVEDRVPRSD